MEDNIASMLVKSGCYINSSRNDEKSVKLPDGSNVNAYLSCRLAISNVEIREKIEEELVNKVKETYDEDITVIGMATAGITWAHSIAQKMRCPMLYMRNSEKSYGIKGLIEGNLKYSTNKAIIIDDILYTGNTVNKAMIELKKNNIELVGVACIATLKDKTVKKLEQDNIKVINLTEYKNIIDAALDSNVLNEDEYNVMRRFYEDEE